MAEVNGMPAETWTWKIVWALFFAVTFFIGSIPFGKIISRRVARVDITRVGSRNIGATNVAREVGIKWGFLTLALDISKGLMPSLIFRLLYPDSHLGLSIVGLSALLGHQFTPFLDFKGGKGVATALGFFLSVSPAAALLSLCVFLITVYLWNFVSLGSMIAALSIPLFVALFTKSGVLAAASMIAAVFICLKHKDNIHRLAAGCERRWRGNRKGHGA